MTEASRGFQCIAVVLGVSLLVEDLTCLYHFDSDSYGEELYAVTLFGFFFCTRIVHACFAFCPCQHSYVWISTVLIILLELAQAILMTVFVDGFNDDYDSNMLLFVFGIMFALQLVCEVSLFFLNKYIYHNNNVANRAMGNINGDDNDNNNDNGDNVNAIRAQLLQILSVVLVGIYTIPGFWMTQSFKQELYSLGMDTIFTIAIICFELLMFLLENKVIGAPQMTCKHETLFAVFCSPMIVYILAVVCYIGIRRTFYTGSTNVERVYMIVMWFSAGAYIFSAVFLGSKKGREYILRCC